MHGDFVKLLENTLLEYETYTDKNGVTRDDEGNVIRSGKVKGEWQNDNITKKYKSTIGRNSVGSTSSHEDEQAKAANASQDKIDAENAAREKKNPGILKKEKDEKGIAAFLKDPSVKKLIDTHKISDTTIRKYWIKGEGWPARVVNLIKDHIKNK